MNRPCQDTYQREYKVNEYVFTIKRKNIRHGLVYNYVPNLKFKYASIIVMLIFTMCMQFQVWKMNKWVFKKYIFHWRKKWKLASIFLTKIIVLKFPKITAKMNGFVSKFINDYKNT